MTQFSPQAFGKYFLVDKIATGGMAEIFKAKTYGHGGFEHLLVIKRILSHLGENNDFVDMFIDEAKVSVALQHPNIIRIYDFGKILENYFIAMECVEGKDTRNLLRKLAQLRRMMPIEYGVYIAYETCKGLQYAHTKTDLHGNAYGIVHRDISPSNVIIGYDGQVKIADFGIAKAESNAYETQDGVLKGKYEYMSPEQAHGLDLQPTSDLFSVGIILHEMLTGRRLFKTKSDMETLEKIRNVAIGPPSEKNGRIPPDLDKIVMKALTKDRADRYQSAEAMAQDLRSFLSRAPDDYTEQISRFMQEIFRDEIKDERARLQAGSQIAEQLRNQLPVDNWDTVTESTMGPARPTGLTDRSPMFVITFVLTTILMTAAITGLISVVATQVLLTPTEVVETEGTLEVMVLPDAEISIDGVSRGTHGLLAVNDVEPGEHKVTITAEGYAPVETSVIVLAGEKAVIQRTLVPLPQAQPDPVPKVPTANPGPAPAAGPPVVVFESTPSGATVTVDGSVVGTTPMRWRGGSPGGSYSVTFSKPGHASASGTVSGLRKGRKKTFTRTLEASSDPGTLKVVISGGGWANVYINGKAQKKTAPLSIPLMPGTYEVRVVNEASGIDTTKTITVNPGETTSVQASP